MDIKEWLGKDNTLGLDIWHNKYQHKGETFDEWLDRISNGDKKLRKLILEQKFLFGGRVLANRGIENSGNYYNCFSMGAVPDDFEGIMNALKEVGITFKAQGGQGVSLSELRPKGAPIKTNYTSDGIVPFMRMFNEVTKGVSQGNSRRGALMISLDATHKEVEDFITIKTKDEEVTRANLSLEINDEFMNAVQKYYDEGIEETLHIVREYSGHIVEYDVVPIKIYKLMMQTVWDWGEPGCIFTERFRNYNLMEKFDNYKIITSNPCGEQPLGAKMCCNLGSLNLYKFVKNPFTDEAEFDYDALYEAIGIASNALDDIIDENAAKLPDALHEYRDNATNWRNIGLGVFGYADMLMALGLEYGSPLAIHVTKLLFEFISNTAIMHNEKRGTTKGDFPNFDADKINESKFMKHNYKGDVKHARNCSLLSIAPTGSIATMLGLSGGIEPEFALSYTRRTDNLEESYKVYAKVATDYFETTGEKELPKYFVTSEQIPWKNRVDTQSVIQDHIDTAISSTVNLPQETTVDEIEKLYLYAWQRGVKGITIFRSGCKRYGILIPDSIDTDENDNAPLKRGDVIAVSDNAIGKKRKLSSGCGSLHCSAFFDPNTGDLLETYLSKGSTGGCGNFMTGVSRMISLAARGGVSIDDIVDQLMSTGACPSYTVRRATKHDTSKGSCCPMAVGYALREMHNEMMEELRKSRNENCENQGMKTAKITECDFKTKPKIKSKKLSHETIIKTPQVSLPKCPECGEPMIHEGGCINCKNCGYSKCD